MPPFRPLAVGIDLGNASSLVAHVDDAGQPVVLGDDEEERVLPTAVWINGEKRIVGHAALAALENSSGDVARNVPHQLGLPQYAKPLDGHHYPPEILVALVMHQLRSRARLCLGDLHLAVLATNGECDDSQRGAIHRAAYMAGFELLELLPDAAAIALALQHAAGDETADSRWLICDAGHTALRLSCVEITEATPKVVTSFEEPRLGLAAWSRAMADRIAARFQAEHGLDPRDDFRALSRLLHSCEGALRILGRGEPATVSFRWWGRGIDELFEPAQFSSFFRAQLRLAEEFLSSAPSKFSQDHLAGAQAGHAGGMLRFAPLKKVIAQCCGPIPLLPLDSSELVAVGAALRAEALLRQDNAPRFADAPPLGGLTEELLLRWRETITGATVAPNSSEAASRWS